MAFMTSSQTGSSGGNFKVKSLLAAVLLVALSARGAAADCPGFSCVPPATAICRNTPTPSQPSPCTTPGAIYCRYEGSLPSSDFFCGSTPISINQAGTGPILVTLNATSGSFVDYAGVHGGDANCEVRTDSGLLGAASVITVSTPSQTNSQGKVTAKGFSNVGFCFLPCTCSSVSFPAPPSNPGDQCPGYSACPARSAVDNCGNSIQASCAFTGPLNAACGSATQTWTAACPNGAGVPVTSTQLVTITDSAVSFGFTGVGGCPVPSGCPTATSTCRSGGASPAVTKTVGFTDEANCAAAMTFSASNACNQVASVTKALAICA